MRIPFGRRATVSGWLGTPDGTALGGQPVRILTAPNDGSLRFTQAAVVRTSDVELPRVTASVWVWVRSLMSWLRVCPGSSAMF